MTTTHMSYSVATMAADTVDERLTIRSNEASKPRYSDLNFSNRSEV